MGLPTRGRKPAEFLLALECGLWEGLGEALSGSEEGLLDSVRFVAGKSPLKDFKALGSGPIEVIRSR